MRTAWINTFAAALCTAGFAANLALANPASMTLSKRAPAAGSSTWPWSGGTPSATASRQSLAVRPAEPVSPIRHPIQYMRGQVPGKSASAPRPAMAPANAKPDALSLSTPTGPPSPELFIFAGQMCERQNDIPQARNNFQRALNMWPGHVEVLRAAARMEDRQGNLPLAENLYGQAVRSNPQHAGALNDLGLCLARQGKLQPSLQVLEQAVQLQPTKSLYRNNAATVLVEMHQDQRALAHLSAVHGAADANFNLGQLLVERGRSSDAVPYFQAALQQNPTMQPAQDALAKLQSNRMAVARPTAVPVAVGAAPPATPATTAQVAPMATTPATGVPVAAVPTAAPPATPAQVVSDANATNPQYVPPVASRPTGGVVR